MGLKGARNWAVWEGCVEGLMLGLEACIGVCWLAKGQWVFGGCGCV